jgi:putative ABC transport system permease protein
MIWLRLALRNVLANRRRSAIAVTAIAVAALGLMLFAGYIAETREGMKLTFIRIMGTGHLQFSGKGGFGDFSELPMDHGLTPDQRTKLKAAADRLPAVRRIVPRLEFSGIVSSGPRTLPFSGQGVDPSLERATFGLGTTVASGRPLDHRAPEDGVILGAELAHQLGVKAGDFVTVMTTTALGATNAMDMTVVGTRQTGSPQGDLYYLQAKLPAAQKLLVTDRISKLVVLLEDEKDMAAVEKALNAAAPGINGRTWLQLQPTYRQVIGMFGAMFQVFGVMILTVTLMGVAVLILTSVMERSREIGVMRSLGIAKGEVRRTFVYEGLIVALGGIIVGGFAAVLATLGINALHITMPPPPGSNRGYPLKLLWDWGAAAEISVIVLVLGLAASWTASSRVARLKVVQALGAI